MLCIFAIVTHSLNPKSDFENSSFVKLHLGLGSLTTNLLPLASINTAMFCLFAIMSFFHVRNTDFQHLISGKLNVGLELINNLTTATSLNY
jgi:hypothetical protein